MKVEDVAKICHQANKSLCEVFGDSSQYDWKAAPAWQRASAHRGVLFCLKTPDAPASSNHEEWMKEKIESGWKYGPVKDPVKKEHPCIVSFDELPPEQQAKDFLFKAIVNSLASFVR